jgi:hypothetical protein
LQTLGGSGPRRILAERCRDFRFDLDELGLEGCQSMLHPCLHLGHDLGVLQESMELVAHLLAEVEQIVALRQTLL